MFCPRERGIEYHISDYEDEFYIRTNLNAQNFKLMKCGAQSTSKENWKDVIPHREDVLFEGMEVFSEFLVLEERSKGLTGIRIIHHNSGSSR